MIKIFLDTNIILDFIDNDRDNHKITQHLFILLDNNNYQVVISEDMLNTLYYLSKKDKTSMLRFLQIIQDKWLISPFGKSVVKKSIETALTKKLDLEDVLQCLCAKQNNCQTLITSDNYFDDCGIKIQNAAEFLASHN